MRIDKEVKGLFGFSSRWQHSVWTHHLVVFVVDDVAVPNVPWTEWVSEGNSDWIEARDFRNRISPCPEF